MVDDTQYCTVCDEPLLLPDDIQRGVCTDCDNAFRGWAGIENDGEDGE
jgi:hypothetical protein